MLKKVKMLRSMSILVSLFSFSTASIICYFNDVEIVLSNEIESELPFEIQSKSGILMEIKTGTVLYEKDIHNHLPPASVTKIMTLLLIYEGVENGDFAWEDLVTASEHSAGMGGSQIFLEAGETQTVADMTKAIAIASANDGAVAMAEFMSGSEEDFVMLMNNRAKELGMNNTTFKNACGLDEDGHVTTAYDLALLSRELMGNHSEITEYTTKRLDTIIHNTRRGSEEFGLTNTNKLITTYDGITGLKTGSTSQALYCLSATAKRDDLEFISVVLSAPDTATRFEEGAKLLDYGFNNFAVETGHSEGKIMAEVSVDKGKEDTVSAVVKEEIYVLMKKESGAEWESKVDVFDMVKAPIEEGAKLGELTYLLNGAEIGKTDLLANSYVGKANFHTILEKMLKKWC